MRNKDIHILGPCAWAITMNPGQGLLLQTQFKEHIRELKHKTILSHGWQPAEISKPKVMSHVTDLRWRTSKNSRILQGDAGPQLTLADRVFKMKFVLYVCYIFVILYIIVILLYYIFVIYLYIYIYLFYMFYILYLLYKLPISVNSKTIKIKFWISSWVFL